MAIINVVLRSGSKLIVPTCAIAAAVAARPAVEPRLLALIERDQVEVHELTSASARRAAGCWPAASCPPSSYRPRTWCTPPPSGTAARWPPVTPPRFAGSTPS
jgi:hypothetical protein